jgi:hypothetical protein
MALVYLDQNALIALGHCRPGSPEAEVERRIKAREITLVLSTTHLLDSAGGRSGSNSALLADFIDFLRPFWVLERTHLHRLEIQSFLRGFSFDEVCTRALCKSLSELVADMAGLDEGGALVIPTARLVMRIRRSAPQQARAYAAFAAAFRVNRNKFSVGGIPPEWLKQSRIGYVRQVGGIRPGSSEDERLQLAPADALRSISCASEAMVESWRQGGAMTPNRIRDRHHLVVALPYADFVLSFDKQVRQTISAVRSRVPFRTAIELGSAAELLRELNSKRIA